MNWFIWALLSAFFARATAVQRLAWKRSIPIWRLRFARLWSLSLPGRLQCLPHSAAFSNQQADLDLSDSFRAGDWTVLAVLLPSPPTGRSLACRSTSSAWSWPWRWL